MKSIVRFIFILLCVMLCGCAAPSVSGEISSPQESLDSQALESTSIVPTATISAPYQSILERPIDSWTDEDLKVLLSTTDKDMNVKLEDHVGGRNFLFGFIGSSVKFSDANFDSGWFKFGETKSETPVFPALLTIHNAKGKLLKFEIGGTFADVMEIFGEAEVHYVTRVGGGVKSDTYYVYYMKDGLIFIFHNFGDIPDGASEDEILQASVDYIYVMTPDSVLLKEPQDVIDMEELEQMR